MEAEVDGLGHVFLWPVALLLVLLYIFYRWGYEPFQVFKRMGVPGPPPRPFLGNLLPLITKEGMDVIAEWTKKYGSVYGFYSGTWPALGTTDPLFIQNIFITNFKQFYERPIMNIANTQATGLPPGIFEHRDLEPWRALRYITLPAFSKAKLSMISCHLEKSCSVLVERMVEESSTHHSIDIMSLFKNCSLESSILAVLGQEVSLQRGEANEFKSWIEFGTRMAHGENCLVRLFIYQPIDYFIGYQFPWLMKLYYWLGAGRFIPTFRKLRAVIENCITERRHRSREKQLQESSVLDLLVAASERGGGGGGERGEDQPLRDEEIISNCLIFLFAAYDTTSLTLTCASHLLATNPHIQDKLCSLIDQYWSQHKDASVSTVAQEVPYLDMVLDETMRLYPPAPRIGRTCTEDIEVCGISIPKGMSVVVPVHYLHRMESIWGDPDTFRPERFEMEESEGRPACCFMPMGLGPRNCIGLKLAKLLMKVALVSILRRHHFTRTPKTADILETNCCSLNLILKTNPYLGLQRRN